MILVTRHNNLAHFLRVHCGLEWEKWVTHIYPEQIVEMIRGKEVFGVLPYHLAAITKSVTIAQFEIPEEKRGRDLNLREMKESFLGLRTYTVSNVEGDKNEEVFGKEVER